MTAFPVPHLDALGSIPSGLLYPHQADGVVFLISKKRAILGDDMGLGKTRQAIVALETAAPGGMILVVCPYPSAEGRLVCGVVGVEDSTYGCPYVQTVIRATRCS